MSFYSRVRSAAVLLALLFACQPVVAVAGSTDATQTWPIAAPSSVQTTLDQTPIVAPKPQQLAQAGPGSMRPGHIPLWPSGLEYTIDASFAWAMGNTGAPQGNGLPGGMDVIARWGFSPS